MYNLGNKKKKKKKKITRYNMDQITMKMYLKSLSGRKLPVDLNCGNMQNPQTCLFLDDFNVYNFIEHKKVSYMSSNI